MTRRSVTTVAIQVKMRLPPGVKPLEAVEYVKSAVKTWAGGLDPQTPMFALQPEEVIVKLQARDTVYL